jgi:serine/threonine-protein kinase
VQAELVDSATESQLWGEQYRRPFTEMQGMQEEIAWHISEAMRIRLTGEQKKRLTRKKTHSSDAYQEHLRGRYHWNRWTPDGFRAAVEHFERAVALDPTFAPAWSGIGDAAGALAFYDLVEPAAGWPKARDAALRAVQLDERLPDAHTTLALVHMFHSWNWAEAEREFRRAIELNPSHALAHSFLGMFLAIHMRQEEADKESRRAVELEPMSLLLNLNLGWSMYQARRYPEAIRQAHHVLALDPAFHEAHALAATAHERMGNYSEAARHVTGALQSMRVRVDETLTFPMPLRTETAEAYWRSRLNMMEAVPGARGRMPQVFISAHLGIGDIDGAVEIMERLVETHAGHCVFLKSDPAYDGLKGLPRYEALIAKVFPPHTASGQHKAST